MVMKTTTAYGSLPTPWAVFKYKCHEKERILQPLYQTPLHPSSMLEGALGCFVLQVAIKIYFEISSLGFSVQHWTGGEGGLSNQSKDITILFGCNILSLSSTTKRWLMAYLNCFYHHQQNFDKTRPDRTRQDKTRQDKTRQTRQVQTDRPGRQTR